MVSFNAFALAKDGHLDEEDGQQQACGNGRRNKRPRLPNDASTAIQLQVAHLDTSLEVDIMILDYITCQATKACLASRDPRLTHATSQDLSRSLTMSEEFLALFKRRHPDYVPDATLRFRLLLIRFATLYTQRLTRNPSTPPIEDLQVLREENRRRAQRFIEKNSCDQTSLAGVTALENELPVHPELMARNRAQTLWDLKVPAEDELYEDAFYGTSNSVSLLDLLPYFMQLSAACNTLNGSNLNRVWMQLACDFMLQACIEQYMVCGARGQEVLYEAYAWGYQDGGQDPARSATGAFNDEINDMFEDEDYEIEVKDWAELRSQSLAVMMPAVDAPKREANGTPEILEHLQNLSERRPIKAFELSVLSFLTGLSDSIGKPVLAQLETGALDGMTKQETNDFLQSCGLTVLQFYQAPANA